MIESNDMIGGIEDSDLGGLLRQADDVTRAQITEAIGAEEVARYEAAYVEELAADESAAGLVAPPDPSLPEIVLLHGITDCHLADVSGRRNRIWLDTFDLLAGRFTRLLPLQDDGMSDQPGVVLRTDGHVSKKYRKALRAWTTARFRNQVFCYDWRRSVPQASDELLAFLKGLTSVQAGEKVVLVCHSMGGLVAATLASRHAEWSDLISHCVFVGSPLGGSYSVPMAVLGKFPSFQKMDRLSLTEGLGDFQRMAASFPGLIDLLPNPEILPEAADFYHQDGWPGRIKPLQARLDDSAALKELLWTSPLLSSSTHLISQGHDTVAEMPWNEDRTDRDPLVLSREGDGAVLTRSSLAPGLRAFKASGQHGTLVNEESVHRAVMAIARGDTPDLPEMTAADLAGETHSPGGGAPGALVAPVPREPGESGMVRALAPHFASEAMVAAQFTPPSADDFDRRALHHDGFSWKNALSLAVASADAYRSHEPATRHRYLHTLGFDTYYHLEHKETQGFVCWDDQVVVVSIRGTEKKLSDWIRNLLIGSRDSRDAGYGKVHYGFWRGYEVIAPQLQYCLEKAGATGKKIFVTGHSLGGAVGTIAGAELADRYAFTGFYTYGQPFTGKEGLVEFVQNRFPGRFFRFVNNEDLVARIPWWGFEHVGQLFWFDANGELRRGDPAGLAAPEDDRHLPPPISEEEARALTERLDRELAAAEAGGLLLPPTDEELEARGLFRLGSVSDHSIDKQYIPLLRKHASRPPGRAAPAH